jgi:hypothetical protein
MKAINPILEPEVSFAAAKQAEKQHKQLNNFLKPNQLEKLSVILCSQ